MIAVNNHKFVITDRLNLFWRMSIRIAIQSVCYYTINQYRIYSMIDEIVHNYDMIIESESCEECEGTTGRAFWRMTVLSVREVVFC